MGLSQDDVAVWKNLGTITPEFLTWKKFQETSTGGNSVFRVKFTCSDFSKVRSFIWLRPRFQTAQTNQVERATRVYPKPDDMILEFPVPKDLFDRNLYFRDFEIIKGRSYSGRGIITEPIYQVQLEEIWG